MFWGVVKVRGDGKSVGGVEKCWVKRGKVCWNVGKVKKGRGVGKCWGRCGKVCWHVGEVKRDEGWGEVLGEV